MSLTQVFVSLSFDPRCVLPLRTDYRDRNGQFACSDGDENSADGYHNSSRTSLRLGLCQSNSRKMSTIPVCDWHRQADRHTG